MGEQEQQFEPVLAENAAGRYGSRDAVTKQIHLLVHSLVVSENAGFEQSTAAMRRVGETYTKQQMQDNTQVQEKMLCSSSRYGYMRVASA
jgi:hypothetical protein